MTAHEWWFIKNITAFELASGLYHSSWVYKLTVTEWQSESTADAFVCEDLDCANWEWTGCDYRHPYFAKRLLSLLNRTVFRFSSLAKQGRARQDGKNYLENSLAQDPSQRTWWENEIWTVEDYINSGTYNHLNSFMIAVMQEVYNTLIKTILLFHPTSSLLLLFPPTHVLTFWKREEDLQNLIF